MGRTINLTLGGERAVFGFRPIERASLYGRRRRVAFDMEGNECSRASLLIDGSLLLQSGMTAQGYFLDDGTWVPQSDLSALTSEGKEAVFKPSTIGIEVELTEIKAEEALSISFSNTYALEPEEFSVKVKEELDNGKIFSFPFNFKDDYNVETGILVGNETGYFALIGNPMEYLPCKLENVASITEESSDNSSDDLDFEMF